MARPKLGKGDSERLQMVITTEELVEIEKWRYANGIPSKSEAIRRLCQIALFVDENLEAILDLASDGVSTLTEQLSDGIEVEREILNPEHEKLVFGESEARDLLRMTYEHDDFALEGVTGLRDMLLTLYNGIAGLINAKSYRGGQRALKEAVEQQSKRVAEATETAKEHAENRYIGVTFSEGAAARRAEYKALPEDEQEAYITQWIDDLRREEEADPDAFAERYGIEPPFWEKDGWADRLREHYADIKKADDA